MTLSQPFQTLLSATGYITTSGRPADGFVSPRLSASREDLERYDHVFSDRATRFHADALFRSGGTPVILFKDAALGEEPSDELLGEWHAVAWNRGLAPLLWVITPSRMVLVNSYAPPKERSEAVILSFPLDGAELNYQKISGICGRLAFDTGAFWRSSFAQRIDRRHRVDAVLLRHLADLERSLMEMRLTPLLSQKLIGRAIFSQYLVDRRLLTSETMKELFGYSTLADVLRDQASAQKLFIWTKYTFNGDLFPPDVEGEDDQVTPEHLRVLADFLDGFDPESGQRSMFPFRFDVIPVELISSIYEQFAHSAAGEEARAQGLHYTPTNLVDLTLDRVLQGCSGSEKVLDPACGSGVFLVEALRRLVWKRAQVEGRSRRLVREVLRDQICGVDINQGALQVTAFSLYLAVLELDPDVTHGIDESLRFEKLIGRSLFLASFLEGDALGGRRFDVIVGNPPWTYAGKRGLDELPAVVRYQSVAQPRRTPDWSFLWRAKEYAKPGARLGLLMKATPFFSKDHVATNARRQVLAAFSDVELINMSELRNEGLFPAVGNSGDDGGRKATAGPALLITARVGHRSTSDVISIANVPWSATFRKTGVLELAPEMRRTFSLERIVSNAVLFKAALQSNLREFEVLEGMLSAPWMFRLGTWAGIIGVPIKQGIQVKGGRRADATALLGLPFLDAQAYQPMRLSSALPAFSSAVAHFPRDRAIYNGPVVLCPEAGFSRALERGRYSAAIHESDVVYTDSFVGISFAGKERLLANVLCALLNSKVVAFQLALGGSNFGLKQPKVEKIDLEEVRIPDIAALDPALLKELDEVQRKLSSGGGGEREALLKRLDEAAYAACRLNGPDRRLVDDALSRTRPLFLDTRTERLVTVEPVKEAQFANYAKEFVQALDTVLAEENLYHASWSRVVKLATDVMALRFDLIQGPPRPQGTFEEYAPELFEKPLIDRLGGATLPKFHGLRFLRAYTDHAVYIVKPNERRHWQISDAQADAKLVAKDLDFRRATASGVVFEDNRRGKISPGYLM